jgi:hypothetical protein
MEYLAAIDEKWRFLAHRSLTPLEWAFAEAFEIAGIPLGAVLEGMCRAFERFRPRAGQRQIRSFMYCLPVIADTALEMFPDTYWQARRSTPSPTNGDAEKGTPDFTVSSAPRPVLGTE